MTFVRFVRYGPTTEKTIAQQENEAFTRQSDTDTNTINTLSSDKMPFDKLHIYWLFCFIQAASCNIVNTSLSHVWARIASGDGFLRACTLGNGSIIFGPIVRVNHLKEAFTGQESMGT